MEPEVILAKILFSSGVMRMGSNWESAARNVKIQFTEQAERLLAEAERQGYRIAIEEIGDETRERQEEG